MLIHDETEQLHGSEKLQELVEEAWWDTGSEEKIQWEIHSFIHSKKEKTWTRLELDAKDFRLYLDLRAKTWNSSHFQQAQIF